MIRPLLYHLLHLHCTREVRSLLEPRAMITYDLLSLHVAQSVRKLSGHCQRRKTSKRQKHLTGRPNIELRGKTGDKRQEDQKDEEILMEANEKLNMIYSDFQSSLKYRKVNI